MSGSRQCGLTKGKSCLTNLLSSYEETSGFVGKGRAVGALSLNFIKTFNTVSRNVLASK